MNKYTINYKNINLNGGFTDESNFLIENSFIEENDKLDSNWPPEKGRNITVYDDLTKRNYQGSIIDIIWNNTGAVVKINDNNYVDPTFVNEAKYNFGKGHILLLINHQWSYLDDVNYINDNKTGLFIEENNEDMPSLDDNIVNIASNRKNIMDDNMEITNIDQIKELSLEDKIRLFDKNDHKILSTTQNSFIPNDHESITGNPLYSPLLQSKKKDYFSEKEIDIILSNTGNFSSLSPSEISLLNNKINAFETIEAKDVKLIVNKNICIKNLITEPADEINEGSKIKNWIEVILKSNIFKDLIVKIHEGYVYITREGIQVSDKITKELVPHLKFFKWQENKPIDYHTLKYVIFQNAFQKNIENNIVQKREAEDILSQEYIIALQPTPYYLLWTLKRLIMLWYGDPVFEKSIRKIKVLINNYRADPKKEYNKKNGILPEILIYPKYGHDNARIALSKIDYYFSLYIDESTNSNYKDIQWKDSHPTYFNKKNSFIYYSNGSIDLKNYIAESLQDKDGFLNDIFNKNYSELIKSKKIMSV